MPGFFKAIKNILTYKDSPDNTFELLENENEGKDDNKQKTTEKQLKSKDMDNKNDKGKPLSVDAWNEARKEGKGTKAKAPGNMVSSDLKVNLDRLEQEFKMPRNMDIVIRDFKIAKRLDAFIIYIDGMVDTSTVNGFILRQVMAIENFDEPGDKCPLDYIRNNVLAISDVKKYRVYEDIIPRILNGLTAMFIEGCEESLLIETRGYEKRKVDKPITENVVRGPQEGFTENLRTNVTLIRRIIRNRNLISEFLPMGKTNNTSCAIMYLDGVTNTDLINEVRRRVNGINKDYVAGDGMLEQLIEDQPYMLLPQLISTERPDRTASFIIEGKVAIIAEGSPFSLCVPMTFFDLIHTSEDSFLRWQWGTALRFLRLLGMIIALFLPALYIALTLFHQEMIPTELLFSIIKARESVPFPTVIEVIIMEVSFELIREGGIRVPGIIGQTLGIIGALILGQAAVAAGIVSPILIIIVAVTGLGSFAISNYSLSIAVRIIRFIFIFFAATLGFYGISLAIFILGGLACSMKSFGVPLFSPIAPKTKVNPDIFVKQPIWNQKQRPDYHNTIDRKRAGDEPREWTEKRKGDGNK